ncbi:unnamed protein product [Cuscuta epithymum]|uniref:F-box associated beta-propeller type 3 domain-containing protein n=1 Tax=Cuscuta epithymum TaxID=186058 RepID=A0AAV0DMV0_9ASTE|nr:unnamed protein product [Cuscuta epithymum]
MLNCTPEQFYTINYEGNQTEKLIQAKSVRHTDGRWFQYGRSMSFAKDHICFFNEHLELMVFNLIAGQHTALPKTPSGSGHLCALLGYDGVSGRHNVLKAEANFNSRTLKYWVFTLGVDETWREIKSPVMFYLSKSFMNSVCINGVIYSYNKMYGHSKLVAFDVRSESFHPIPLPPATYEYFRKLSLVELDARFAVMYVHQNKLVAWSLETARSCWKKHTFSFPLEKGVLGPGGGFFPRTFITATPAGEIVLLLMLNGTPSLWVLLDKFGPDPVWKEFRIRGLADIPTGMSKMSGVAAAQNIAHDHIHLE